MTSIYRYMIYLKIRSERGKQDDKFNRQEKKEQSFYNTNYM